MGLAENVRRVWRMNLEVLRGSLAGRRLTKRLRARAALEPGTQQIAVYFADDPVNLYQIRQWYGPLEQLAKRHPVVILARTARTALTLLDETTLPVVFARKISVLEQFLQRQPIRIVFYVNQNARNFQMMRYGRRWHVYINHGESDKAYMRSNQYQAYDYAFIAGEAAQARLQDSLWGYDVQQRTLQIGRPQVDFFSGELPYAPDERTVVLYAPTWEGDRASMAYGSIRSHGVELVRSLLATGRHRVIYRPHPRSGIVSKAYGAADREIIRMLAAANRADPTAQHVHDQSGQLGWQLSVPEVAITDISAMMYDRLATGKPLLVTRPASEEAVIDADGYLAVCEWLTAERAGQIVAEVDRMLTDAEARARGERWSRFYFGDTAPGAATARFESAVETLLQRWQEHSAQHPEYALEEQERFRLARERWQLRSAGDADPEQQAD